jgi:HEAT repeat protein
MSSFYKHVVAVCVALVLSHSLRAEQPADDPDELLLRQAKVRTDTASLLAILQQRSTGDADLDQINRLVADLGSSKFAKREEASRKLNALGSVALPALRKAVESADKEVVRRAKGCLEEIARQNAIPVLPVVRLLLKRRPTGTEETLLRFLPYAADSEVEEEMYFQFCHSLEAGAKFDRSFEATLDNKVAVRRALAGFLVARFGDERQKKVARKLLDDSEPVVRLRTAQGFLAADEKTGIPTLIRLLEEAPLPVIWQAEELLHYAAGESSPTAVVGMGTGSGRRACRAKWESWWREKRELLDLTSIWNTPRRPRLALAFQGDLNGALPAPSGEDRASHESWEGRIWLCGCEGHPRCRAYRSFTAYAAMHLPLTTDRLTAVSGTAVALRFQQLGLILPEHWEWGSEKGEFRVQFAPKLGNGNRMVVVESPREDGIHRLVELDRQGHTVWEAPFENPVGGLVVYPLVRAGFNRQVPGGLDLETPRERAKALKSHHAVERLLALQSLRPMEHDDQTSKSIVAALDDNDPRVRRSAAEILRTRADVDVFVRLRVCERIKVGPRASRAIPNLIRRLNDPSRDVQHMVVCALIGCGVKAAPPLISVFEDRGGPRASERRLNALVVLTSLVGESDPKVQASLRRAFQDSDPIVRQSAIELIAVKPLLVPECRAAVATFAPQIVTALNDSDKRVVRAAEENLRYLEDAGEAAVPYCLKSLQDARRRPRTVLTLSAIGKRNPRVLPALIDLVKPDQDVETCEAVAQALGEYGGQAAHSTLPVLRRLLQDRRAGAGDGEMVVQLAAIRALAKIGPKATPALPDLVKIAKGDPSVPASHEARVALERIDPAAAQEVLGGQDQSLPKK